MGRDRGFLPRCAEQICTQCKAQIPDLSQVIVLLPNLLHIKHLKDCLTEQVNSLGEPVFIPPQFNTLRQLALDRDKGSVISNTERHFILGQVLSDHPNLLTGVSRWQLSASLLSLFDELSLHHDKTSSNLHSDETQFLLSLYCAWQEYLEGNENDQTSAYRHSLINGTLTNPEEHVFLCGIEHLFPLEKDWVDQLQTQGKLTDLTYLNEQEMPDRLTQALDLCFINNQTIKKRTEKAPHFYDDVASRLQIFTPNNLEQHTQGIALNILEWLECGIKDIAVVTQDRRFARRLRATLSGFNIDLYDYSGWSISTTVSASAVNALIDNNPPHEIFLHLSRSPFAQLPHLSSTAINAIEKDLVRSRDVPTWDDLARIASRSLPDLKAIHLLRDCTSPIAQLDTPHENDYALYFAALEEAMEALNMTTLLSQDDSGKRTMEIMQHAQYIAHKNNAHGTLYNWRHWLYYLLDNTNFISPRSHSQISLLNLNQARLMTPQALVLAALDNRNSGDRSRSPLITEISAQELGLHSRQTLIERQFIAYRRLIEGSQKTLLSYESNEDKTVKPLPWVDKLQKFYTCEKQQSLENKHLAQRASASIYSVRTPIDKISLPRLPAPRYSKYLPDRISVSACNTVIQCPYQFFSKYILSIAEERRLPNQLADPALFGTKIHRCMEQLVQSLHEDKETVTLSTLQDRQNLLTNRAQTIVDKEFSAPRNQSYINTHQRLRASRIVQQFIKQLAELAPQIMNQEIQLVAEQSLNVSVGEHLSLRGKIDLTIQIGTEVHIVDYKTGTLVSKKSVETGDDIQLAGYALLQPKATQASYLGPEKTLTVSSDGLNDLRHDFRQLLDDFHQDSQENQAMLARGSEKACTYCSYEGLCRKQMWRDLPSTP